MSESLKILFIASRFPYPPLQGDRVRAYHQLKHLARRHRITLVVPVRDRDLQHLREIEPLCERVAAVPVHRHDRALNLLAAPFSPAPWQTTYWHHPKIARAVRQGVAHERFDVAHVQLVRMAPVGAALDGIPRVLDFIDALSLNFRRRAERRRGPIRLLLSKEAARLWRYENRLVELFDRTLITSVVDRDFIGARERTEVVPNGVDIGAFPHGRGRRSRDLIVFTGRMGYPPNAEGAVWFCTEVLPIVRRNLADVRLMIAGADPPARVRALTKIPGVEVTGCLPDLGEPLRQASLAISPMLSASGIQNKVLEAMASGTPMVVTPQALGGLDAEHERHLLVGGTAQDFAAAVVRLMKERSLRVRLAREARALVESRYTWEHSVAKLEAVYRRAVEDRRIAAR